MKANYINYVNLGATLAAVFLLTNCAAPSKEGWHRPARPGERVGQVTEVTGTKVTMGMDEACLVHVGDVLTVKRLYCDPRPGKKNIKDCQTFESGSLKILAVNAEDHSASGHLLEGSATVDSPVFMTDPALYGSSSMP
jgi:hypothetical protein